LRREQLTAVFRELKLVSPELGSLPEARQQAIFASLDIDGDGQIEPEEFSRMCEKLRTQFHPTAQRTWFQLLCPALESSRCFVSLSAAILHPAVDWAVDAVLLANFVLMLLRGALESTDQQDADGIGSPWALIDLAFTAFFFVEMCLKLTVLGGARYFDSPTNIFDALVSCTTAAVTIAVYTPNRFNTPTVIRQILTLRVLRSARLINRIPQVRFISSTFVKMLRPAASLTVVLLLVMYTFSALGQHIFGGLINKDPVRPQFAILANDTYGVSDYYANNFNDMYSGMVLCTELIFVNNWWVLAGGPVAVTSRWARLFFVLYYITAVLVCLNIVVAFAVDAYMKAAEEEEQSIAAAAGADAKTGAGGVDTLCAKVGSEAARLGAYHDKLRRSIAIAFAPKPAQIDVEGGKDR